MTINRNTIWNKPLPRFLGFFVLLLSLGSIFWLSGNVVLFDSKAALGNSPKDVQISNISNNTATVSFFTDASVIGSISYGKSPDMDQVALDSRDTKSPAPHTAHYFTLSGLDPGTKYYFSIASGDSVFQNDKAPYELTTTQAVINNAPTPLKISGQVTLDGKTPPAEAIVYVNSNDPTSPLGGSQLMSSVVKSDGTYEFNVQNLLKKDLSGIFEIKDNTILKMNISDSTAQSKVSFFANQSSTVPPIILSKDYDFTVRLAGSATASESANIPDFPVVEVGETTPTGPQILTPTTNEKFEDPQPLFEGKGLPQSDVEITIESDPIIATVQTDQNGNWKFRPTTKLEPGVHKITIKTLNAEGIIQSLTRSFTVLAEGSQFTEPSILPTSPITSTPTTKPPTITLPTATTSPLPTASTPPTMPPTAEPTAIVIVPTTFTTIPVTSPSTMITMPPVPDSGSSAVLFGILGTILTIGIGGLIFLLI